MTPQIRYVKTSDGVNIAYTVFGEGEPVIAASNVWGDLHLFRSTFGRMRGMYQAWADAGLKVALYDARSMGASDHNVADISIDARMRDIDAVAEAAGFDRFGLTAVASAVPTAITYAAENPQRVSGLFLANGGAKGSEWYASVPAMRVAQNLRDMADDDWETYTLSLASAVTQFSDLDAAAAMAAAFRSSATAAEYFAWVAVNLEVDVTPLLPRITVPTRVVFVEKMIAGTLPFAREIAAGIPGAVLMELDIPTDTSIPLRDLLSGNHASSPSRPQKEAASAFRTILFTDLVAHTAMMRRLGDAKGREVLREHEALTRRVLHDHGGAEVKTMGDGFMASFTSVTRAVECAVALQKAIADRNGESGEPLDVRVGLNAGEPIEEDGDLFGETVILASRIAGMAEGGEILASTAVRELCAGKGFDFADLGEHLMRGFEDPVRVFEIKWRD